jgi:hypothetical protein
MLAGFRKVVRYLAICQESSEYLFVSSSVSASLTATSATLKALSSALIKLFMSTLFALLMSSDSVRSLWDSLLVAVCLVLST